MVAVRRTGRSFNDLKGLVRRLDEERRLITRNSALAALLVTVCRRVLPVRQVDPDTLRDIPASCEGYRRIMDFYFFTDAGLYFFGDYPSGPNWFVRLKRNVAILMVRDVGGHVVYNHFAVSGEHRAPGAPLALDGGPLRSTEAKDEHGRVFNRQHDAEFKLLSGFCASAASRPPSTYVAATGTLWSRKPLCSSCLGAIAQVRRMFPQLELSVSVGAVESNASPSFSSTFGRRGSPQRPLASGVVVQSTLAPTPCADVASACGSAAGANLPPVAGACGAGGASSSSASPSPPAAAAVAARPRPASPSAASGVHITTICSKRVALDQPSGSAWPLPMSQQQADNCGDRGRSDIEAVAGEPLRIARASAEVDSTLGEPTVC